MSATQPVGPGSSVGQWRNLGDELQSALDLQRAMRPPGFHRGPRFEVAAAVRASRGMAGEFFDYEEADGALRLTVGNVCGTGAPAALQAAVVQGILAVEAKADGGPAQVVGRLNRTLCRRPFPDSFVTLFYGVVAADGSFTHCHAGHCRPLLITGDHIRQLGTGGPPAGVDAAARYEQESVVVGQGDMLLVFSEGLESCIDAERRRRCMVPAHLVKVARKYQNAGVTILLERLLRDLWPHTPGDQSQDHLTAVIVRCLG